MNKLLVLFTTVLHFKSVDHLLNGLEPNRIGVADMLCILSITSSISFCQCTLLCSQFHQNQSVTSNILCPSLVVSSSLHLGPAFPERPVSGVWFPSPDLMHPRLVCIARVSPCLLCSDERVMSARASRNTVPVFMSVWRTLHLTRLLCGTTEMLLA